MVFVANERKCPNKDCYSWVKMSPRVACKSNQPKKMFPQSQVVEKKKSVTTQNSILSMYRAKSVSAYLLSRKYKIISKNIKNLSVWFLDRFIVRILIATKPLLFPLSIVISTTNIPKFKSYILIWKTEMEWRFI